VARPAANLYSPVPRRRLTSCQHTPCPGCRRATGPATIRLPSHTPSLRCRIDGTMRCQSGMLRACCRHGWLDGLRHRTGPCHGAASCRHHEAFECPRGKRCANVRARPFGSASAIAASARVTRFPMATVPTAMAQHPRLWQLAVTGCAHRAPASNGSADRSDGDVRSLAASRACRKPRCVASVPMPTGRHTSITATPEGAKR
jgi:hypothetical protein